MEGNGKRHCRRINAGGLKKRKLDKVQAGGDERAGRGGARLTDKG